MSVENMTWTSVCDVNELSPVVGVRALFEKQQVAIFKVRDSLYALDAVDPFSKAAVLARGIVGDLKNQVVVASPIYKQHFNLASGVCLEDDSVRVQTFPVREYQGKVQLGKRA